MIRQCDNNDFEAIYSIINDAAEVYKDLIPDDCFKTPYMPGQELRHELVEGVFGAMKNVVI